MCAAKSHHEWLHEVRHREKDAFINTRRIGKFFAEALGLRVSAEHGGRQPRIEERHVAPWWDERPKKLLHEIYRRDAASSTAFDKVIRTTAIQAQEFRIRFIILSKEEEEKLKFMKGRLRANYDFDDEALEKLGFHHDIYKLLENIGWKLFSDGVMVDM